MSKDIHILSEVFMSLEAEFIYSGFPTLYFRYARCNLKCPGFNNPTNDIHEDGYATLNFNPKVFARLQDMPLIEKGCDSQYSTNVKFKHTWLHLTDEELSNEAIKLLPHGKWIHPTTKLPIILSITGGEPTATWKNIVQILKSSLFKDVKHILIETNCTVPLKPAFLQAISEWLEEDTSRRWTWSNSPKLSSSGEQWNKCIKPEVALSQQKLLLQYPNRVTQYFKFVVNPIKEEFDEIEKAMNEYYNVGIDKSVLVGAMNAACTDEQQQATTKDMASMCIDRGYCHIFRQQNAIWGNGVGT